MEYIKERELQNEAVIASVVIVALSYIIINTDVFETWYHYSRAHETWELDELLGCLFAVLFVGASLAVRHVFVMRRLMHDLKVANQRILEQNLLQARQEKLAALGELSSGMAHEISNALQPMMGLGPFIRTHLEEAQNKKHLGYMELILDSAGHIQGIIENVLSYTRDKSTEMLPYEAYEVIGEALKFSTAILPSTLFIETTQAPNPSARPLILECNKTGLTQVFANILKNASDAMEAHGTIRISLTQTWMPEFPHEPAICIKIADSGRGMDRETMEKIFNPFFTTKDLSMGTGLGLSVVHGLVRQHRGCITVQSAVGEGSTFSIYLPVLEDGA
jgi:signal transduction histidine kinase